MAKIWDVEYSTLRGTPATLYEPSDPPPVTGKMYVIADESWQAEDYVLDLLEAEGVATVFDAVEARDTRGMTLDPRSFGYEIKHDVHCAKCGYETGLEGNSCDMCDPVWEGDKA